jgi:hypothetical protein
MDTVTIVDYFPNPSHAQHDMKGGGQKPHSGRCLSLMQGERAFACTIFPGQNANDFHNYIFQYLNINIILKLYN